MDKYDKINNLVDLTLEQHKCPKGFRWCKFTKKCVPEDDDKRMGRGLGRGQGKGPIGKPVSYQDEMFAVDNPEFEKVKNKVDMIVDSAISEYSKDPGDFNNTQNDPAEKAGDELNRVHDDIAGYGNPEEVEKEYPPGPQDDDDLGEKPAGGGIGSQLEAIFVEKGEYHAFFKRMMDEEGVNGIKGMSVDQKKDFFRKVSKKWKAEKGKSIAEEFIK